MIELDGSIGEGGGQVLRTALTISCVLGKPVRITNIRKGRGTPGLKAQHLSVCNLLAKITNASMIGAAIGSTEISFSPGKIDGGEYEIDIGTAGSCTLLSQAVLPVLLHSKKDCTLSITGGTHVSLSPTYEYFSEVFLPAAKKFGVNAGVELKRAGFYPKGGGKIVLRTKHSELHGAVFSPQTHDEIKYSIISSSLPPHVLDREEAEIARIFAGRKISGAKKSADAACPGNACSVWSGFLGASSLGAMGKPAEKVANEACKALLFDIDSGASVDSHLADQLLLYAALSYGKSSFSTSRFTDHLTTNAEVLRRLTGRDIILAADRDVTVDQ